MMYLEHHVYDTSDFSLLNLPFFLQGLATIPVSAFYSPEHSKEFDKYIRFCFVKVNKMQFIKLNFILI